MVKGLRGRRAAALAARARRLGFSAAARLPALGEGRLLFWVGSGLSAFLGYRLFDWWVPAVLACAVAAAQFFLFQALFGEQGGRFELLLSSLLLNLMMYYATFSIGRAIGQRLARRRKGGR